MVLNEEPTRMAVHVSHKCWVGSTRFAAIAPQEWTCLCNKDQPTANVADHPLVPTHRPHTFVAIAGRFNVARGGDAKHLPRGSSRIIYVFKNMRANRVAECFGPKWHGVDVGDHCWSAQAKLGRSLARFEYSAIDYHIRSRVRVSTASNVNNEVIAADWVVKLPNEKAKAAQASQHSTSA